LIDVESLKDPLVYIPKYFRVLSKANEKGTAYLVPMVLKPCQEYYIKNRTHRDVILKGRQQGMSTGVMAANAHRVFTQPYTKMAIITHKSEVSEFLLQTVHRFYNNLPKEIKPRTDWASGRRMKFPDLDAYIHIDSAESEAIGFGETLSIAHLSEVSRWVATKSRDLFNGISQTVPMGGHITVESTPKGRGGLFYDIYSSAKKGENGYKAFFFPWWWEPDYKIDVDEDIFKAKGTAAARRLNIQLADLEKEEAALVKQFKLTVPQLAFRREKIRELRQEFYQEYPENDEDCWLTSEVSVFDGKVLRQYLLQCEPGRQEGDLTVWKGEMGGDKYVIGVDVAAGLSKGDYSVASVLSVKRNEYVARLRGRIAPDLFAEQVIQLGYRYNAAEIGVEKASHGHTVLRILLERNYPNIYHREEYDQIEKEYKLHEPGWYTSVKTRPLMINSMNAALRASDIRLWSENFCAEALGFIWEGNIAQPSFGGYDDELDALMIALQLRENAPLISDTLAYRPSSYIR
jgi:hypothetical protein